MPASIPLPDAKLTTEREILDRLESVHRQHNEAVYAPGRPGPVHITTLKRKEEKIRKLFCRMEALSSRLRDIRRSGKTKD